MTGTGHTNRQQQLAELKQKTFASLSQNSKEKERENNQLQ